jgi:cytochrome c oxidase subunit 2
MRVRLMVAALAALGACWAGTALAAIGQPSDWEITFQGSVTPIMDFITWFHTFLVWIISAITVFVLLLLLIVMVRFNSKSNPVPSRTTHNAFLEVAWTVLPVVILVIIAVPSFRLLGEQLNLPPADITVKATGKQWYWTYSYPDDKFEFDSLLACDQQRLKCQMPRLLAVDNEMVVPVNKTVRVQVIGADVIHAFAVPSFGVKIDAIPGRLNETWFRATREGMYYGQCSELCGKDHAYMPIAVRVVSDQAYATWLEEAKKKYADTGMAPTSVAAAESGSK